MNGGREPAADPVSWNQVAGLRPRLVADARIHRHSYRGVPWYVVQDGASARHVRLAEGAWRIAGAMNGERTLDEIHAGLARTLGANAPGHRHVVRVLKDLHEAELVECEALDGVQQLGARQRAHARQRWRRFFASPISQRIPLVDPQRFLTRWLPSVLPLVSRGAFAAWLAVCLVGLAAALSHWQGLSAALNDDILRPDNLLLLAVAYVLMKTLHELGHAFVTRAFGGEVHEMGVMLLVFVPVPYVDASASSAFASKRQRMAVGAAGIMVELFVSTLALGLWLLSEPGLVRDVAFSVLLVGGVSTLLFNGNPLLRFDGYYVLCDALEIPNLGSRSVRYLGYLVRRYVVGAPDARSPVHAAGERRWFVAYGLVSNVYRVAILVAIVLFVAERYPLAGVVIGVWVATVQFVLPAVRAVNRLAQDAGFAGYGRRALVRLGLPAALIVLAAVTVPLPSWTYAEGVVWLPDNAQARAGADGYVVSRRFPSGAVVEAGAPLFTLRSAAVTTNVATLEQRVQEHQARYDLAMFRDRARLEPLRQQLARMRAELDEAREQAAGLLVQSPLAGTLKVDHEHRLDGRFVRKGEALGFVVNDGAQAVRVVLLQDEIDRVREHTERVRARLAGHGTRAWTARIDSVVPSATRRLPAAALGAVGGGRVPVSASDSDGLTASDSVFVVDVALPDNAPRLAAGTRVFLRFDHDAETLFVQTLRALRRLFLTRFGV
ncbi:MAG: peptidase M50 [Pseudomonadota bacterium]